MTKAFLREGFFVAGRDERGYSACGKLHSVREFQNCVIDSRHQAGLNKKASPSDAGLAMSLQASLLQRLVVEVLEEDLGLCLIFVVDVALVRMIVNRPRHKALLQE